MAAAGTYMESIRKLVFTLFATAVKYLRVVFVLDGVDHIRYLPLNAIGGPKRLEVYEVAARMERRNSLRGAASTDPFFNVAPPLWWMPHQLPVGLGVVFSLRDTGPNWATMQERHWGRECVTVNALSAPAAQLLMDVALERHGTDQAWGHNHGLLFRTVLDDVFVHETLETVHRLHVAPPALPPAKNAEKPPADAPPVVPEPLEPLLPAEGDSFRVLRVYCVCVCV